MREQIDAFLTYLELERGISPATRTSYQHDLRLFETFLRKRNVGSLTRVRPLHVREFLQSLRATRSPATVARKLAAVKGLFRFLEGQRVITRSPTAFIEAPRLWRRLPQVLRLDEVLRILGSVRAEGLGLRRDDDMAGCNGLGSEPGGRTVRSDGRIERRRLATADD